MYELPILSILIWQPMIFAAVIVGYPHRSFPCGYLIGCISAALTVIFNIWAIYTYTHLSQSGIVLSENLPWIGLLHSNYHLMMDGLALVMISLSSIINLLVIVSSKYVNQENNDELIILLLILQSLMNGLFLSQDALLFFVFFESMLIPMYLCIGRWGSSNRNAASMKFFIYTFLGSIFLLIAIVYLGMSANSFDLNDFYRLPLSLTEQSILLLMFLFAFGIKIPMFPFHTWLPDAHTEAPASGSAILAALLLKVGAFGLYRFVLPITPDAVSTYQWPLITLSLISIVYIGTIALTQSDIKRLIAYSSVAHMGFVTLGCWLIYPISLGYGHNAEWIQMSIEGSMIQMISHGFASGALFLAFGLIYNQNKQRDIEQYSGLANVAPKLSACFLFFCLSNIGIPGTAGFVGEFMVVISAAQAHIVVTCIAAMTLILSASYTLWMYRRVFHGRPSATVEGMQDIKSTALNTLYVFAAIILLIGLYPECVLQFLHQPANDLIQFGLLSKLPHF